MQSLKEHIAAGDARASAAEARACKTLDKISKLRPLVEWLTRTVGVEVRRVARLVEVELSQVQFILKAALTEIACTVSGAICGLHGCFPVDVLRALPDPSAGGLPGQP